MSVILQRALLHFTGIGIQEDILEVELGHPRLIAPAVYWKCVLADMLEFSLCQITKLFNV